MRLEDHRVHKVRLCGQGLRCHSGKGHRGASREREEREINAKVGARAVGKMKLMCGVLADEEGRSRVQVYAGTRKGVKETEKEGVLRASGVEHGAAGVATA
jgi:hypothetical protein